MTHLRNQRGTGKQDTVVSIGEEVLGLRDEVVDELRNFLDDSESTKCCLQMDVRVVLQSTAKCQTFFRI